MVVHPEAEVQLKHKDIEVTLPSLQEDVEIAAFGRPGKEDKKRMQIAIFAKRPKQGKDLKIWVYLVDDTNPAFEVLGAIMIVCFFKMLPPLFLYHYFLFFFLILLLLFFIMILLLCEQASH